MARKLASTTAISISQLSPELSEPSTKSIRGAVTLIWPYSSSNETFTLRLAEPDVRLRRANGEVRVSFQGSSARTVFEAGIGSGDEVKLSLEGAEWVKDGSAANTPRRGIEWELKFTERLLLEIRESDSQDVTTLDIDHPPPRDPEPVPIIPAHDVVPIPPSFTAPTPDRPGLLRTETNEWSSPAFIKRARLSYGSLMESSYDMFAEDDGTVQGKGRKRTKFGRDSGSWRYNSRSPSLEAEAVDDGDTMQSVPDPMESTKPLMLDEACQTADLEYDAATTLGDLSRQAIAAGGEVRIRHGDVEDGTTSQPGKTDVVITMPPPPRPQLVLDPGSQENIGERQVVDSALSPPSSPRLLPVSSDGLSLVSPLVSSSPGEFHGNREAGTNFNERPTLQPEVPHSLGFEDAGLDNRDLQPYGADFFDVADQYGHWQNAVANSGQLGSSMSPPAFEGRVNYPELNLEIASEIDMSDSGPYFTDHTTALLPPISGDGFPSYPRTDEGHVGEYRAAEFEGNIEEEEEIQRASLFVQPPGKRSHHSSIAMSRSQSVHSELIDLTEESDEENEADGTDVEPDVLRNKELQLSAPIEDDSDAEDERDDEGDDDEGVYDEDGEDTARPYDDQSMSEDELDGDRPSRASFPPGFHPLNSATSGTRNNREFQGEYDEEQYDDSEEEVEEESEEDYEDEEEDEEPHGGPGPAMGVPKVPEVIDLLSSDEDDAAAEQDISEVDADVGFRKPIEEDRKAETHGRNPQLPGALAEEQGVDAEEGTTKHRVPYLPEEQEALSTEEEALALFYQAGALENGEKFDIVNTIDVDVVMEDKESVKHDTHATQFGYDGHQELEAEDFQMDAGWEFGRNASAGENIGAEAKSKTSEIGQAEQFVPTILVDEFHDDQPKAGLDGRRASPSFADEMHGALDVPSDEQIVSGEFHVDENTEIVTAVVPSDSEMVSEMLGTEINAPVMIIRSDDGASQDISYPVLPPAHAEDTSDHTGISTSTPDSSQLGKIANGQLPTPDATQLADLLREESFSSMITNEVEAPSQPVHVGALTENDNTDDTSFSPSETDQQISAPAEAIPVSSETARRHMRTRSTTSQHSAKTDRASSMLADDLTSPLGHDASAELALDAASPRETNKRTSAPAKAIPIPLETPKRHMRTRSSASQQSPKTDRSSSAVMDDPSTPPRYDASVDLALEALESPTKTKSNIMSTAALRMELSRSLRTNLLDFTPLKSIRVHLNHQLNILAIATTSSSPGEAERAKGGPRHYLMRFNITDNSLTNGIAEVQIFRPYRDGLPTIKAGDGILLQKFQVKSERGRGFPLRSDEASKWAVFEADGTEQIRGGDTEHGLVEKEHIASLKAWFGSLDATAKAKLAKVNGEIAASPGKASAKAP